MLEGRHIGLRAIEREDLESLLAWRNRPEFRRYFREYRELSMAQQLAWYSERATHDKTIQMFSIVDRGDGRLLGACGLCYINWVNRNADLSIYIGDKSVYIDGIYAPDAARTLMAYGFGELGLHRIWSEIYDIDHRKIALFDTLGMKLEGRHRQTHWTEGRWVDSLFYGILAPDFEATVSAPAQARR